MILRKLCLLYTSPLRDTDSNEKVMALEGQSEVRLSYMQNNFSVRIS